MNSVASYLIKASLSPLFRTINVLPVLLIFYKWFLLTRKIWWKWDILVWIACYSPDIWPILKKKHKWIMYTSKIINLIVTFSHDCITFLKVTKRSSGGPVVSASRSHETNPECDPGAGQGWLSLSYLRWIVKTNKESAWKLITGCPLARRPLVTICPGHVLMASWGRWTRKQISGHCFKDLLHGL